jgi:hypothetical protein
MSDDLSVNTTSHCDLCSPGMRNWQRHHVGPGPGPRVAVCPVHDIAGPPELLPDPFRVALGMLDA